MFKTFMAIITKLFKSKAAKEILKVGIDVYVEKNDNTLTNNSADAIKRILDETEEEVK